MSKKILIIDDEPDFCEMLAEHLQSLGYHAFFSIDASEAMDLVKVEQPDLVFLDVKMPQMSGLECLEVIKREDPHAIVVMLSGIQDERVAKRAIEKGAYDYISKPFDFEYLENNVLARIFH